MSNKNRYFTFFYTASNGVSTTHGVVPISNTKGEFPPHDFVINAALERANLQNANVAINNWQEMSEDDYYSFYGEQNPNNAEK